MCSLRENIHEIVTVSVHSNVAKIHSRLPAAMELVWDFGIFMPKHLAE